MKKLLILILICFSGFAFGKDVLTILPGGLSWIEKDAQCVFPQGNIQGNSISELAENASAYLKKTLVDLKNENTGLVLTYKTQSPYAMYFTYTQTFRGYEIYGTSIKIGLDKNHNIVSVISKTAPVNNWPLVNQIGNPDEAALRSAIGPCDTYSQKKVWFYDGYTSIPAYDVTCNNNNGSRSENLVLNLSYEILYQNNLIKNYKYPDSLAKMYVFYPDPLTSAKVPYGEPYANHGDSDVAVLDSQMLPEFTRVSVLNDSFFLENEFVNEAQLGGPQTVPTYSKNGVFHFNRDTNAFRDIMVYYHINNWRQHLKDIGYDSLGHSQITVDAQSLYEDNSNFTHTGSTPYIYYGIGGVPDAEDADVTYHEYSHFLSYSACPGCSEQGFERSALDEGMADYFAASFSKAMNTYNWQKIYNWDGNATGWSGRSCAVADHYPEALNKLGEVHLDGQLWSSSLMQIWDVIGRNKTDAVMIETLYSLAKNLNMTDAAKLFIKCDSLIYNGADARIMAHYFIQRGFLPSSYMGIAPINQQVGYKVVTSYFSSTNKVIFDFEEPQTGILTLYDITGKEIASNRISHAANTEFMAPGLASGIYILNVNTGGLQKSFKLLK